MKAKYRFNLEVDLIYDIDTLEDLKDNNEMGQCLREIICDEVTYAGGVAQVTIEKSMLDVR